MSILTITSANFDEEVLASDKKVLLDFWATWCGPCRMQSPIIDQLASSVTDVVFGKINVDEEEELAMRFGIQSIPTLVVIEHGKVVTTVSGLQSKKAVLRLLGKE